jgi:AAA+ superfamily predicted ATPase
MCFQKFLKYFKKGKHSPAEENAGMKEETIENEDTIISNNITTMHSQKNIPVEFSYLQNLISYRLGSSEKPEFPPVSSWDLPVKNFLEKLEPDKAKGIATFILIGLAPHAMPDLFDRSIEEKIKASGDFPEIGGVRGKNFRGFLPTGQTAVFLLAGNDWAKRKKTEALFWPDSLLIKKKILWLEELPQGEPVLSGKITMALEYIDLFLSGVAAPPHFSTSFPATKINTELTLKDIVPNKDVEKYFGNLKDWINHNPEFFDKWGMQKRLRRGYKVLFYGPPGTGKTLIAGILGNETGKDVYRIDISMVVSKYIGETEKNLEILFARAEDKNWILFFDEADAIFGKRTGVRDAHDKYANQEVSYLLQRIEDFNGLIILATNMKNNIDDAFIRRFNDIVKFTVPNEDDRKRIWEKSFPDEADYEGIPEKIKKYEITGANIINTIHFAGIQAIKRDKELSGKIPEEKTAGNISGNTKDKKLKFYIEDILEGIRREMIKEGKPFNI